MKLKKYGKNIELLIFNIIDTAYVSEAESAMGYYFDGLGNRLDGAIVDGVEDTELVYFDEKQIKSIKYQYSLIGSKYEGKVSKHAEFIKDMISKHEKELLIKDNELSVEKYENKLLQKDKELLQQQIEIMKLKSKKH